MSSLELWRLEGADNVDTFPRKSTLEVWCKCQKFSWSIWCNKLVHKSHKTLRTVQRNCTNTVSACEKERPIQTEINLSFSLLSIWQVSKSQVWNYGDTFPRKEYIPADNSLPIDTVARWTSNGIEWRSWDIIPSGGLQAWFSVRLEACFWTCCQAWFRGRPVLNASAKAIRGIMKAVTTATFARRSWGRRRGWRAASVCGREMIQVGVAAAHDR